MTHHPSSRVLTKTPERAPLLPRSTASLDSEDARDYRTFPPTMASLDEKRALMAAASMDEERQAQLQSSKKTGLRTKLLAAGALTTIGMLYYLYSTAPTCALPASAAPKGHRHNVVPAVAEYHDNSIRVSHHPHKRNDTEVCDTAACKSFADSLKAGLALNHTAVDPCTDFSTYVCGNWRETHDFRPDQSTIGVLSIMADVNNNVLHSILESPYADNSTFTGTNSTLDKQNFAKMKAAYNACMDESAIAAVGATPLQKVLNDFNEKFPPSKLFKSSGNGTTSSLTDALIWLKQYGVSGLVSAGTTADDRNPDVVTIYLSTGATGLPTKEYYNSTAAVANYTTAITGMFDNIFETTGNSSHADLAKQIVALETKLAQAEPDPDLASDVTYYYNPKSIAEADQLLPQVSFSQLLAAFVPKNYTIDTVLVMAPDYFPQLATILESASQEALYGYFQWSLIQAWGGRLSSTVNAPLRRLNNQLTGRDPEATTDRWRTCISEVDENLPWIESAFYVQRAFGPDSKTFGDRIVDDIKAIFTEKLQGYAWMSDSVKTKAAQKVANIVKKIGYPTVSPDVMNPKALSDYYSSVTVTNSSYFDNGLAFNNFSSDGQWTDLSHPTDKNRWFMSVPTVNAYYNPASNEIAFPAGIMQTPIFDLDLPEYVSYGAFGAVVGHELTHGFDDSGSHYDETGAYRDWWDNATLANFEKKTDCFVNQFSNFTITTPDGESLNVNGKLTLGENIADSGGLSASFAAWKKREAEKPNLLLPGLEDYTKEQLFYLSYGGLWCGKSRPAEAVRRIYSDPHSPPDKRILGTVANQVGFREAFNCPVKEPTCELW